MLRSGKVCLQPLVSVCGQIHKGLKIMWSDHCDVCIFSLLLSNFFHYSIIVSLVIGIVTVKDDYSYLLRYLSCVDALCCLLFLLTPT